MITQFRLENFKAHRDTELALGPFTVLVATTRAVRPACSKRSVCRASWSHPMHMGSNQVQSKRRPTS